MKQKYKPGQGWKALSPAVYEHESGTRIHLQGLCRLADGTFISGNDAQLEFGRYIRIAGNRKRGMMAWANTKKAPSEDEAL